MNVKFDTKNIARAVSTDSTDVCKHRKLLWPTIHAYT